MRSEPDANEFTAVYSFRDVPRALTVCRMRRACAEKDRVEKAFLIENTEE